MAMEWWRRRRRHWPAAGGDRRRRRDIGDDGGDSDVGDEMKTVAGSCGDGAVAAAAIANWRGKVRVVAKVVTRVAATAAR